MTDKPIGFSQLPDPTRAEIIPDDRITGITHPAWDSARFQFSYSAIRDRNAISPQHSLGEVTISGFNHIDKNIKGAGESAAAICRNMADSEQLTRHWNRMTEAGYAQGAGVEAGISPMSGPLKEKGPFQLHITQEAGKLVFGMRSASADVADTARVEIPTEGIRKRCRSYMEFIESAPQEDAPNALRHKFDRSRKNEHNEQAAFIGEKFAQQGWYIGQGLSALIFELSLYMVTPAQKTTADYISASGRQTSGNSL